jgi:dihydrofolate reductase
LAAASRRSSNTCALPLVDEMHLAIAPTLLGCGEALLAGIDLPRLGYQCTEHIGTPNAMHVVLTRQGQQKP